MIFFGSWYVHCPFPCFLLSNWKNMWNRSICGTPSYKSHWQTEFSFLLWSKKQRTTPVFFLTVSCQCLASVLPASCQCLASVLPASSEVTMVCGNFWIDGWCQAASLTELQRQQCFGLPRQTLHKLRNKSHICKKTKLNVQIQANFVSVKCRQGRSCAYCGRISRWM